MASGDQVLPTTDVPNSFTSPPGLPSIGATVGAPYAVEYKQGATTNPAIGRYGDFPSAFAASLLLPYPTILQTAPGFVPPGVYVLPSTFQLLATGVVPLDFQEGAVFQVPGFTELLISATLVPQQTATAVIQVGAPGSLFAVMYNGSEIVSAGTAAAPFIAVTGGGNAFINPGMNGILQGTAAAPIFDVDAASSAGLELGQFANLGANTLAGAGPYQVVILDASVQFSQVQSAGAVTYTMGGGTLISRVVAENATAQSFASGTAAIVTGWTDITNESPLAAGSFDPATGLFVCPLAGFYSVSAELEYSAIASVVGGEFTVSVLQNGSTVRVGVVTAETVAAVKRAPSVATQVQCAAGDVLAVQGEQSSGSATTLSGFGTRNTLSIGFSTS